MGSHSTIEKLIKDALVRLAKQTPGTTEGSRDPIDRRRFVRAASGLLLTASIAEACGAPTAGATGGGSGIVTLTITGLGQSVANGGSVTVLRTDISGQQSITVNIPASGSASASGLPTGTYQVTYTPPAGYQVTSGTQDPQTVQLASGGNSTVTFAVTTVAASTGNITITVTGLGTGLANGGSASVLRTDISGQLPTNVPLPATGSTSASGLTPGTYSVTYTPPSGYLLGTGVNNPQSVQVTASQTQTVTFAVVSGSFATPTILTNVSFEDGWDGFVNFSGSAPSPSAADGNGYSVNRSQDYASQGSWSTKVTFGPNSGDDGVQLSYDFSGKAALLVYARVYFYIAAGGAIPNNHHKWIRFVLAGFNGVKGGLYLASNINNGGITWDDADSYPNGDVDNDIGTGTVTKGVWHSIEVCYDRTGWNTANGARAQFWYDGKQTVGNGATGSGFWGDSSGNPNSAGPWYYTGQASSAADPSAILDFDDTFNAGNTNSGAIYYDQIAISTQRIGP
jgi:hypothetical protein